MNNFSHEVQVEDENTRDEFSAAHIFKRKVDNNTFNGVPILKKKTILKDITHTNIVNNLKLSDLENNVDNKYEKEISRYNDIGKTINKSVLQFEVRKNKDEVILKKEGLKPNIDSKLSGTKISNIKYEENKIENYFTPLKRLKMEFSRMNSEQVFRSLFEQTELNDENFNDLSRAFETPANGLNSCYRNFVAVSVNALKVVRIDEESKIWKSINSTSITENRVILASTRKYCIPQHQFLIVNNQYKSSCLINEYVSPDTVETFLTTTINFNNSEDVVKKYNRNLFYIAGHTNSLYFHELFLEKLQCNKIRDFMPSSTNLTGISLSTFVNKVFEYSNIVSLSSSTIHLAVEFIYQYLSRVDDVPEEDLKWITVASTTLASKYDGSFDAVKKIEKYESCKSCHIHKAELRLLMVIDSNLSKPHAIYFRNRFLTIEQSNSTVLHLSSFILDMILHCYTVMLEPSSLRAAASVWLARLIDKFDAVRFNREFWDNMSAAREKMNSVWPKSFEMLTGYSHQDISLLGLRMHVIIVTFLSKGEKIYPSVRACYDKYSHKKYGGLTTSYEKFTARTMFYASELYCRLNDLNLQTWLEQSEFDTLWQTFCANKITLGRSVSYCAPVKQNENSSNSCPEVKTKPIISRPVPPADFRSTNYNNHKVDNIQDSVVSLVSKDYRMLKMDSGYSTSSNLSISRDH